MSLCLIRPPLRFKKKRKKVFVVKDSKGNKVTCCDAIVGKIEINCGHEF